MAYGLKYYKELTQPNGKVVRLEILEKGYEGASKEIGPVCQALRLDIQGDTEIDAPIVKTSLSMTFVDAPDHVDARTKKCGNWDEFYTSDATLWRVVLKARNAQETAFATMWGGYITPDSYTEVLQYRGSVTLVARDNIGHLSDFPFDAEGNADGMISLIELIREAWDKIESPMTLDDQAVANADWMLSDGVYAYDTYMNVSAFEDMNWYDALESALYAYGLVLRYTGNNNVSFYSLRNLPRMGAHEVEDISFIEPTFMSGAERELTPAVKRIEEAVEYKIESAIQPQVKHEDFTLNRDYYAYDYGSASGKIETGIVEAISNTDKTKGWANEADKTLFFDPNAYELSDYAKVQPYAETLKKSMYIAVNNVKNASLDNIDRFVTYGKTMRCQDFAYVFNLGMLIQWSGSGKISKVEGYSLSGMTYAVSMERLGITYYYAGEGRWQTSYKELNLELAGGDANNSVEIPIGIGQYGSPDPANFVIYIKRISYTRQGDEASGRGLYVAIQSLEIASPQTSPIFAKNNVNTAYDNTNNVILSRDPKIAPALNTVSLPALIQNGIFIKRGEIYDSAKSWAWDGQTPQQMAVYNHLQLLCYHAKPNNILRGTIVNADVANMQVIWMWHGAEHMLVSGTLDLISGYIENAVLREFSRYEDMWGMLEPADMPEVEGKSSTNVEGGVAASSEGARMTSTTTVNIGGGGGSIVLDTFMSDTSQNGVQNRVIKAYVDDSCSDLDTRLQAKVDNIANNKADNTTVTALAERVSANEGAIDALDKRVTAEEAVTTTYASWWSDLKKYIKVEGSNVKIDTNLIVSGDTSSGGSGQDTPASGTVTGIKVGPMSTDILTPNNAGIIDMVSVLSSIDVSDQLTAYAKTEDVNTALQTKQNTISDLATIRSGAALGATALQSITKDMVTDALGYTPLSTGGGTMTGAIVVGSFTSFGVSGNTFYLGNPSYPVAIRSNGTTTVNGNTLYHSGNFNPADYLPLSGGTMGSGAGIYSHLDSEYGAIGFNADHIAFGSPNVPTKIRSSVDPVYLNNSGVYTLIHSGNIGSQSVDSAAHVMVNYLYNRDEYMPILMTGRDSIGTAINNFVATDFLGQLTYNPKQNILKAGTFDGNATSATKLAGTYHGSSDVSSNPYFWLNESGKTRYYLQAYNGNLCLGPTEQSFVINPSGNVLIGTTNDNGNMFQVAQGASFGGAVTMSSTLSVGGNTTINGIVTLPVNYQIQWGTTGYMIYGTASRIQVDAPLSVSGNTDINGTLSVKAITIASTDAIAHLGFSRVGFNYIAIPKGGTLAFAHDNLSQAGSTLYMSEGQVNINGNLVVSGDTSSGSDIRFKDIIKNKTLKIADIAKAPLFTFKWNDREDDTIHLGSSAQYWEKVTPWLVKGEDFKTLDYSTLGVAMGISLAKKAVNHEERIKALEKEIKRLKEEMIHG